MEACPTRGRHGGFGGANRWLSFGLDPASSSLPRGTLRSLTVKQYKRHSRNSPRRVVGRVTLRPTAGERSTRRSNSVVGAILWRQHRSWQNALEDRLAR